MAARIATADGRILTAAQFAVEYLADPSVTCVVLLDEFTDGARVYPSTPRTVGSVSRPGSQPAPFGAGDPSVCCPHGVTGGAGTGIGDTKGTQ